MPRTASGIRVMVLTPCPMMNMACTVIGLADLVFRQQGRVEPARARNARRFHQLLVREARTHPLVVHFPHPAPMPPGVLGKAVVERQRRHIEAEIGGPLHVGVAAENIGAVPGMPDIAGGKQQNAAGTDIRRAGRELGLSHRPDQGRGLFLGEGFGDMLDLCLRQTGDAFDLVRRPLRHLLADIVDAVNPLTQKLLVFPTILEDVPEHSVDRRDMSAGAHANIFGCVRSGPCHARIDDDHVGAVEFLAFKDMLKRNRVRLRRIAAHDHEWSWHCGYRCSCSSSHHSPRYWLRR